MSQYTKGNSGRSHRDCFGRFIHRGAHALRAGEEWFHRRLNRHHSDFAMDFHRPRHARREREACNQKCDMTKYVRYMCDRVIESLTGYGKIDIMWFGFSLSGARGSHRDGKSRESATPCIGWPTGRVSCKGNLLLDAGPSRRGSHAGVACLGIGG